MQTGGLVQLPINIVHRTAAGQLPHHHEDPFDRMPIAQAYAEGMTIAPRDKRFNDYGAAVRAA